MYQTPVLLTLLAIMLVLIGDILLLDWHSGFHRVPIGGFRDGYFLTETHRQEIGPDGVPYRWTRAASQLRLNQVLVGTSTILTLELGGRPEPARLALASANQPWASFQAETVPRNYSILMPPEALEPTQLQLTSPTFRVPNDDRDLGIKIQGFSIHTSHAGWPLPPAGQALAQIVLLGMAAVLTTRLRWRVAYQALLLASMALALAWMLSFQLLYSMDFFMRLVAGGLVLVGLTWVVLPKLGGWVANPMRGWVAAGELRVLWSLMLGAVLLRWFGVFFPSFGGQDLGRNLNRLMMTVVGQLYIIAPSGEFAKGLTIYPTGPYLALMPGMLLTNDLAALMQGGLALMDAATALLTGLLAYRLGGGKYAGRIALLLYAANLAAFGAMSYSFSAQIFGQWFTAPMALLLLANRMPPTRRTWMYAMLVCSFGVFSHIGVMFLAVGWVGLILLLTSIAYQRMLWWNWIITGIALLLAFGFLYVEIIGPTLSHAAAEVVPSTVGSGTMFAGFTQLLINGFRLAYTDLGILLMPLGFLLMLPVMAGRPDWLQRRVVVLALLGSVLFFFLVDIMLNVQVRYFYFSLPLVLPLLALPLGRIAARGWGGRLVAAGAVLTMVGPYILLWFAGTWASGRIPMTPLTH